MRRTFFASINALRGAKLYSATVVIILATVLALLLVTGSLNALLLSSSLPYPNPAQLYELSASTEVNGQTLDGNNAALAKEWLQELNSIGVTSGDIEASARVKAGAFDERVNADFVTSTYFSVFGAAPAIGQDLRSANRDDLGARNAVISHALAERLVPAGQNPLSMAITIDGSEYRVIGVMREDFKSPRDLRGDSVDVWLPWALSGADFESWRNFNTNIRIYARVPTAQQVSTLQSALTALTVAAIRDRAHGQLAEGAKVTARAISLRASVIGDSYKIGIILSVATLLLCGLGISFVMTMYVARAGRRRPIYALHGLLGARTSDLVAMVGFEVAGLLIAAGLLAVPIAVYFVSAIKLLGAGKLPRLAELTANFPLLVWIAPLALLLVICIAGTAVAGIKRLNLIDELRFSGKGAVGRGQLGFRRVLLTAQFVLVTFALLLGSIVLSQSLRRLSVSPGYHEEGASYLQLELPEDLISATDKDQLAAELNRSLLSKGGISSTAFVDMPPMSSGLALYEVKHQGGSQESAQMQINGVGENFLSGLGMRLIKGRLLQHQDFVENAKAIVLGEGAARAITPHFNAVGQIVSIDGEAYEVIGVVNDVRNPIMTEAAAGLQGYLPYKNYSGPPTLSIMLFHHGKPPPDKATVAELANAINPGLFVDDFRPLTALRQDLVAEYYLKAQLSIALVALVLVMATAGIYALITYLFQSTRTSVATKLALGAQHRHLVHGLVSVIHGPVVASSLIFIIALLASAAPVSHFLDISTANLLAYGLLSLVMTLLAVTLAARVCSTRLISAGYSGLLTAAQ